MKIKANEIKRVIKNINPFSKYLMIYGGILVLCLYISAFVFYVFKGEIVGYYESVQLSGELLQCAHDCLAASFVPALLLEILHIAQNSDDK